MLAPCFKAAAAASVSSSPDASNKALSRSESSAAETLLLDVDKAIRKNKDMIICQFIVNTINCQTVVYKLLLCNREVKMKEGGGSVVGSEVGTQIGQRQIRH